VLYANQSLLIADDIDMLMTEWKPGFTCMFKNASQKLAKICVYCGSPVKGGKNSVKYVQIAQILSRSFASVMGITWCNMQ
jgi:hypothetical protein